MFKHAPEAAVETAFKSHVAASTGPETEAEIQPQFPEIGKELGALGQAPGEKQSDRLRQIITQIGWPTISKVGKEASEAAFQIALHADHDPELQANCEIFLLGRRAYAPEDINLAHIATIQEVVRKNADLLAELKLKSRLQAHDEAKKEKEALAPPPSSPFTDIIEPLSPLFPGSEQTE